MDLERIGLATDTGGGSSFSMLRTMAAVSVESRVLDLECGDGDHTVSLLRLGFDVYACGRSEALDGFLDAVLDPVDCPMLGVTVVPLLHPSYREVWLGRLGLSLAEYRAELRALLP